ncbi:MAG: hypothetical protein ACE5LV_04445, partial [Candidatus Aminicenantales bacterium]
MISEGIASPAEAPARNLRRERLRRDEEVCRGFDPRREPGYNNSQRNTVVRKSALFTLLTQAAVFLSAYLLQSFFALGSTLGHASAVSPASAAAIASDFSSSSQISVDAPEEEIKVRITAESAPIYAEASTYSFKIETLPKGTVLTLFQTGQVAEHWLYVSYYSRKWRGKVTGFIQADMVERIPEAPEKPPETKTEPPE